MPWDYYHRPPGDGDREHFTAELLDGRYEIVTSVSKDNVFYAAVRTRSTGQVWAMVVPFMRRKGYLNFAHMRMDEHTGPVHHGAPAAVLNALTRTADLAANQWRTACWLRLHFEEQARALVPGDEIVTDPVTFSGGRTADVFRLVGRQGRGTRWEALCADGQTFPCTLGSDWATRLRWAVNTTAEKCGDCHLFVEPNEVTGHGIAAYVHLHRGDPADEELDGSHEPRPSGQVHKLSWWQVNGPPEMRARFTTTPDADDAADTDADVGFDGASGQDRESYTDDQDRESYTTD